MFFSNCFLFSIRLVLRKAFDSFDREKSGSIPTDMVADILRLMGQPFNKKILDELIDEVDADSKSMLSLFAIHWRPEKRFHSSKIID